MNNLNETEMIENQMTSLAQDNGSNESRKSKTNKSLLKSKRKRFRKRNNEGQFINYLDIPETNMNNVATSDVVTSSESGNVEVIDVEQVKDSPLVDLTKESGNEIYVDLTHDLPNSPEAHLNGSSMDSSIICISPIMKDQLSQIQVLEHNGITMVAQGSERVTEVSGYVNHPISCAICLDSYDQIKKGRRQLTSTTCGHVFCSTCIDGAMHTQAKCPTCRKKLSRKQLHPLFL